MLKVRVLKLKLLKVRKFMWKLLKGLKVYEVIDEGLGCLLRNL